MSTAVVEKARRGLGTPTDAKFLRACERLLEHD
jgi:hypothetical protein